TLVLRECEHFNARLALDALIHYPHLEVFEARRIVVGDLWSSPQSWACRGLRRLQVTFESDTHDREADTMLFEQLSILTRLEEVVVGRGDLSPAGATAGQLFPRWRLDSGLSFLSNLRRLRYLDVTGTDQGLRLEDVWWMVDNWPSLEKIVGNFATDPRVNEELKGLARQRGVWVV
ncbi:hypothetical protein BGW39_002943, partial [Mortierella sp. 14UC]